MPSKNEQFKNSHILFALCQLRVEWDAVLFGKICESALPVLTTALGQPRLRKNIHFRIGKDGLSTLDQPETTGYSFKMDEEGSNIIIGIEEGILLSQHSKYENRDFILGYANKLVDLLSPLMNDLNPNRVSFAIKSNIPVSDEGETFEINKWIVPKFSLNSSELNRFEMYSHDVLINLDNRRQNLRARLLIESAQDDRKGIDLFIDILDNNDTPWSNVMAILASIKDVETNLYSHIITEDTRTLNNAN